MKKIYLLLTCLIFISTQSLWAQSPIFDPNDRVDTFKVGNPPTQPVWGTPAKWTRTVRVGWNSDSYKAYIYKGLQFRLKYPKNYNPNDTTKIYPLLIFFHGLGEYGTVYDNEYSMYHGGELHRNAIDNGQFDGFMLYPQNTSGYFSPGMYAVMVEMINTYFVPQLHVDPFRILTEGLSAGGQATWEFDRLYPKMVAASTPISAANGTLLNFTELYKFIPIWLFQGGVDNKPGPGAARDIVNAINAVGGNARLTIFEGQGHGVWYKAWEQADYFPFMNRAYKSNPLALFGRTEFCPGDTINVTLGLTPGFDEYQWRKNGNLISGADSNLLRVTEVGTYDVRIRDGARWSDWSHTPVVVKIKTATITPDITTKGLMSTVLPAPDGKDSVVLNVPDGYVTYQWKTTSAPAILGTASSFTAKTPGSYVVKVTERFGCTSEFSNPFNVIAANGANVPDPAIGVTAASSTYTTVTLKWSDKPNPAFNETLFEVYRAAKAGGPYTLVSKVPADTYIYTDENLLPNVRYYYIIRSVNDNGAAPVSNETSILTQADTKAPNAPANLKVISTSPASISITWDESIDEVGVDKYDIYVNGVKTFTADGSATSFTISGLKARQLYTVSIKARDLSGNLSPASNQVTATTVSNGLKYKYYTGSWDNLPNFSQLTPVRTGTSAVPDLSVRTQDENYAFLWEGYIRIPVTGNYTFMTYSDDGSKLYIGGYNYNSTPVVNNDGLHGSVYAEGTKYLTAGVYPIAITFFQKGGGANMQVLWKNTAHGVTSQQQIPAGFFTDTMSLGGTPPTAPANILATATAYNKINLSWTDRSNNETGFEIYRSNTLTGPFEIVQTTGANVTAYTDSSLSAQTTYYYMVKAINKYGSSDVNPADMNGLRYDYYEFPSISQLPDFNSITPVKSGIVPNVTLDVRNSDNNYAFKFSGVINLPSSGTYTFYTASDDGSKLYIDGFDNTRLIVSNDYLQPTTERSGSKYLTAGRHTFYVTYFQAGGGQELLTRIKGPGIAKTEIVDSFFVNTNSRATTFALPPAPVAPSVMTAVSGTPSSVSLKWKDNSNNEKSFEIYRSIGSSTNYILLATIPGRDTTVGMYTDTSLFANVQHFYKVRAVNVGGKSAYSNEASATTLNNPPKISGSWNNRSMRFGTQAVININAADIDGETLTLSVTNLPLFGAFVDNGNGTGTITLNPGSADQGVYSNIQVKVTDQHAGTDTKTFDLTVNDNYAPVITPVNTTTVAPKTTASVTINAADLNTSDVLNWTVSGLPAFASYTAAGNSVQVSIAPGYADPGTYPVLLKVNDGRGGIDSTVFNIVVSKTDPNYQVKIDFTDGTYKGPSPWNNTNKTPVLNDVFGNFLDTLGRNTGIGLRIMTPWQNVNGGANSNNAGASTYINAGVYPDAVILSSWWTNTAKQTMKMTGLDTNYRYNFTFFGSRGAVGDNRNGVYTINGISVLLNPVNNNTNTVTISNIFPDSTGSVLIDLTAGAGSSYAYINAMVLNAVYDDKTAPAAPRDLAVRPLGNGARLSWTDAAYNETAYEVYRATDKAGPYSLLNPAAANPNDTAYTDNNVTARATYYYAVRAVNGFGVSPLRDTVAITIANRAPVVAAVADVSVKADATKNVSLSATDDAGEILTLAVSGLPSFASFTDNGNGTGNLSITPVTGNIGRYTATLTVTDNYGGTSSRTFNILVLDKYITSTYVNLNGNGDNAPAPWNNFNYPPVANRSLTNLTDESGVATGMNVTVLDNFTGYNNLGAVTGNNSGVYPDIVMKTFFYDQSGTPRRVRVSGLSAGNKYNLVFFGSRADFSDNRPTVYSVGAQSVSLNASSNKTNTVRLTGLSPDASGNIDFTVLQPAGSASAYLNALVIQSYADNGTPLSPAALSVTGKTTASTLLSWTDNSNNETGFEIWRSDAANGTFTQVGTAAANATSYEDAGLAANSLWFYKVRAASGTAKSDFTNIASGGPLSYSVYINFNTVNPVGAPWNNTTALPYLGLTFDNLNDDVGNITSLSFKIERSFTGTKSIGYITGNNSGLYPDKVILESYYVELGDTAGVKFSGLDQSKEYSFTFFGSANEGGSRLAAYVINGKTVTLDGNVNTSNTITIDKIRPDAEGEIHLRMYTLNSYGYLNALVIKAFPADNSSSTASNPPAALQRTTTRIMGTQAAARALSQDAGATTGISQDTGNEKLVEVQSTYPNPFSTFINIGFMQRGKSARIVMKLIDMSGRLVQGKDLGIRNGGTFQERLDVNSNLSPGMYLLQIIVNDKTEKTIRVIKH
ncbi:fibronectin type III domain-containing protein [Chitinophaga solisilvae]|uniref:fibronectin type III domain-containing protein n=1 Tax=Chitinophaga solisilvae TaxID=1233460 RepID=UPI001368983E|nr:fibronectin type III domain-containing protein [Chitinophaga solisilvae]